MKIKSRKFIYLIFCLLFIYGLVHPFFIEPRWLAVRKISLSENSTHRIIHFSDLHYRGDQAFLGRVVKKINALEPDFVCFTGDIVDEKQYLEEALSFIKQIRYPVYGVPGNHDYWGKAYFKRIASYFEKTGGAWLVNQQVVAACGKVSIVGSHSQDIDFIQESKLSDNIELPPKQILLIHYPALVDKIKGRRFNLILAGHSHAGQIRLPFIGALILPPGVGEYDWGLFHTETGPLYVTSGIGTWYLPARFFCRPEIVVHEEIKME